MSSNFKSMPIFALGVPTIFIFGLVTFFGVLVPGTAQFLVAAVGKALVQWHSRKWLEPTRTAIMACLVAALGGWIWISLGDLMQGDGESDTFGMTFVDRMEMYLSELAMFALPFSLIPYSFWLRRWVARNGDGRLP